MEIHEQECMAAGLDPKEVAKIARSLERIAKKCDALGILIFGGSRGSLRCPANSVEGRDLVIASLDIDNLDGGDGGYEIAKDGLLRGE